MLKLSYMPWLGYTYAPKLYFIAYSGLYHAISDTTRIKLHCVSTHVIKHVTLVRFIAELL